MGKTISSESPGAAFVIKRLSLRNRVTVSTIQHGRVVESFCSRPPRCQTASLHFRKVLCRLLPRFPPMLCGATFSTHVTSCRVFHSCVFLPCIFDGATFSTLAFSVAPIKGSMPSIACSVWRSALKNDKISARLTERVMATSLYMQSKQHNTCQDNLERQHKDQQMALVQFQTTEDLL